MTLEIRTSTRHGRGVFATRDIAQGELIECCPVLVIPAEEAQTACETVLGAYVYDWDGHGMALALGCGSLYNHDFSPNARAEMDTDAHELWMWAVCDIVAGEEITFDYTNGGESELWF